MSHKFEYPYISKNSQTKNININEKEIANYIKSKFVPTLKKRIPNHSFISNTLSKRLDDILCYCKKYSYYLKLDIKKYYVNINYDIASRIIVDNYEALTSRIAPKKLESICKNELKLFFDKYSFNDMSIPLGSSLSYVLGNIYLLYLDLQIKSPFIRYADDYLIFFKSKKDIDHFVYDVLTPSLKFMKLEVANEKLQSGKFTQSKVCFLGYSFYLKTFSIDDSKIDEFKIKIKKLTSLRVKKSFPEVLKSVNYKIIGFGHYYKYGKVFSIYEELDKYTRFNIRRYYTKTCSLEASKSLNTTLTNEFLKNLGLKCLTDIFDREIK